MANRHLSRSIVLQTLFEWDTLVEEGKDDIPLVEMLTRNVEEFAPGSKDTPFMQKLLRGVVEKQKELDLIIEKAAPEWPINKIARVDRNILRIGLFELLFSDRGEVPAKVAINEAIELGKNFGGENSGRFINGVLGAVYKELGEPGKDETSKKKGVAAKKRDKHPPIPYEQMPIERKGGAVVYAKEGEDIYVALVHDVFGHWTLPKGSIADDESLEEGVRREIKDEIGLDVEIKEILGENEYVASQPEKGKVRRNVVYYLAEGPFEDLTLEEKGGLDDAQWFKVTSILDLNFYHDILPIVTKAINILAGQKH